MRWMNLEPIIQSEVSQKNKYTIFMHIWSLERWYWWIYLQDSNRDTDIKNRLVDTVREEEGGTNWESSMEIYKLSYVKQIAQANLLYDSGSSNQVLCDNLEG